MRTRILIVLLFALFLIPATLPLWYKAVVGAPAGAPKLELPAGEKQCVEPTDYMRRSHRELLNRWKDSVVREGKRTYVAANGREYTMSLTGTCLKCHANKETFCDRCHNYVRVEPNCWQCHVVPKGNNR